MTVHILMIGDCTLATTYLPPRHKNEQALHAKLREHYPDDECAVTNEGMDGESIGKLLKRYERMMRRISAPDYVLIRYGVNDRKEYGVDGFRENLIRLCERLRADLPSARILLETGVYVDYPAHYEFDRNSVLQPIYTVIRELGQRYAMPVVDIYERMQRETEQGNWDLRVRGYGVVDEDIPVLGPGQDHLHVGDVRWWTNIHPNPVGVAVIADEEVRVLKQHWPDTLRF
ncbi:MAG TPA: SGNH/GDSL hydrolase family protein [Herpetosiphonaceae bacterium]